MTRVQLASTPVDRFVQAMRAIERRIDRLPNEAVGAMREQLEAARRQVLAELAGAPVDTFTAARARALVARLEDVLARFGERYVDAVAPVQADLYMAGQALVAEPLVASGTTLFAPIASRRQLEAAQAFQALLISNASAATVNAISQRLQLGVLRGESVFEIAREVAGSLEGPGPFGSLAARAETITRTELGRIQAIASQASLRETRAMVPDLKKQWRHSGNAGPWRREGHIESDGQVVDVEGAFRVRKDARYPYEDLRYPLDPAGSPENTINCGCLSLPFREDWATELEAAHAENADFLRRRAANTAFQEAA